MSSTETIAPEPESIEFECQACASTLEVPFTFLGTSGPCPYCDETATAPTLEDWEALQLATSPVEVEAPDRKMGRRKHLPVRSDPAELAEKMIDPDPRSHQRLQSRLASIKERFFRARIPRIDDSGPSLPQLLGWGTVALALMAVGFGLAVVFYTVPLKPPAKRFDLPSDLTVQVLQEKARQGKLRSQAMNDAQDAVAQFLHSGSSEGGKLAMFSANGKPINISTNLFPDLKREDLVTKSCTRLPGTQDYLMIVEPSDERGPVFIVQQAHGKLLLHADALTQQSHDTVNGFLNAPGEAQLIAYVLARPSQTQVPVAGLESWQKLDIAPAFPTDKPRAFIANAQPNGEAAVAIEARTGTLHFTSAVAEFKWSKTTEGKRFIEVVRVIPNDWGKF